MVLQQGEQLKIRELAAVAATVAGHPGTVEKPNLVFAQDVFQIASRHVERVRLGARLAQPPYC